MYEDDFTSWHKRNCILQVKLFTSADHVIEIIKINRSVYRLSLYTRYNVFKLLIFLYSDKHSDKPAMIASRRMLNMAGVTVRQFVPTGKITIDFDVINMT